MSTKLQIQGIPQEVSDGDAAVFKVRLTTAYEKLLATGSFVSPVILFGEEKEVQKYSKTQATNPFGQTPNEKEVGMYSAQTPSFSFNQLCLPQSIKTEIITAVQVLKVEKKVFDDWGLRSIEPHPKTSLNFYGPPGTGKTMAAHAIAHYLNKKILVASYAEIESKYHGDGPKNVKAIFQAAEQNEAVLFIDEADSLLSKRLTNVTQGSEQAINSMRSQLLINLEQFHGVVIFSTNLVQNYDKAFETRVRHIKFSMPDEETRALIWMTHLPNQLPIEDDITREKLVAELAHDVDDICGRDIRNAVINAAVEAALAETVITKQSLLNSITQIKEARIKNEKPPLSSEEKILTSEEKIKIGEKIKAHIEQKKLQ